MPDRDSGDIWAHAGLGQGSVGSQHALQCREIVWQAEAMVAAGQGQEVPDATEPGNLGPWEQIYQCRRDGG